MPKLYLSKDELEKIIDALASLEDYYEDLKPDHRIEDLIPLIEKLHGIWVKE